MKLTLTLALATQCPVCLQLSDQEQLEKDQWDQALFGAEPYSVCCACSRTVPPERQSKRYVKRYHKFMRTVDELVEK